MLELEMTELFFKDELSKEMYGPLTKEEERGLIKRYQECDDTGALKELVCRNLRYVVSLCRSRDFDIIHAGIQGLVKGIDKIDLARGHKLTTYAKNWIRHEVQRHMREKGVVVKTHYAKYNMKKVRDVVEKTLEDHNRGCTDKELVSKTGLTKKRIDTARKADSCTVSYHNGEADISEHEDRSAPCPFQNAAENEDKEVLKGILKMLPPEEAAVIRARFLDPALERTGYRKLGGKLGFESGDKKEWSHEKVRQIEKKALARLNYAFNYTDPSILEQEKDYVAYLRDLEVSADSVRRADLRRRMEADLHGLSVSGKN